MFLQNGEKYLPICDIVTSRVEVNSVTVDLNRSFESDVIWHTGGTTGDLQRVCVPGLRRLVPWKLFNTVICLETQCNVPSVPKLFTHFILQTHIGAVT